MALMNRQLHPSLETVFLVPAVDLTYLSSSLVREVARFGGDVASDGAPGRGHRAGPAVPVVSFREPLARTRGQRAGPDRAVRGSGPPGPRGGRAAALGAGGRADRARRAGESIPRGDPRLGRIAQFLRERRPDRVRDGVHALDLAADPLHFGAALVALGEAEGCVAGAACPTGRRGTGRPLGDRHRPRRQPGELLLLYGAARRQRAHLHRLRGGPRADPGPAGRDRSGRGAGPLQARRRRAAGGVPVLQHQGKRRRPARGPGAGGRGSLSAARAQHRLRR